MYYQNTTQTPNILFDEYLKFLSESELKVVLTIIRKTIGIVDRNDSSKRLKRAWVSQKLFSICTNLSGRAVSTAIDKLVAKQLITVTNSAGHLLKTKASRRGSVKLYFSSNSLLEPNSKKERSNGLVLPNPVTYLHTIKLTETKLYSEQSSQGFQKLSDTERIQQILKQQLHKNKK